MRQLSRASGREQSRQPGILASLGFACAVHNLEFRFWSWCTGERSASREPEGSLLVPFHADGALWKEQFQALRRRSAATKPAATA